jgi:hypothetical protein
MRDYLLSLRELVRRVVQHGFAIVVGGIGGVLGIVSAVYGAINPKAVSPIPVQLWVTLIFAGTLAAIVSAFHDVRVERDLATAKRDGDTEGRNAARARIGIQGDGNIIIGNSPQSNADAHVTKR